MKNGKILITKADWLIRIFFNKIFQKRPKQNGNRVLLIMDGGLGDALLDAQALDELIRYYYSKGKEVYVVCSAANGTMFQTLVTLPNVHFFPCDFMSGDLGSERKFRALKDTLDELNSIGFEQVVVRYNRNGLRNFYVTGGVIANRKTAVFYDNNPKLLKKKYGYLLSRFIVDEIIEIPRGLSQQVDRSRAFVQALGVKEYRTRLPYLPKQCEYVFSEQPYITVTVDSSSAAKRWPVKRFIELIQKLLERYEYDVVLTGSNTAAEDIEEYEANLCSVSEGRVKNLIGKTDIKEWIELIRNSRFHIGVDSSSIHVAAAVGTQAFCLAGVWDGDRFFPYRMDEHTDGTTEPVCIYPKSYRESSSLACRNCNERGGYGYGNKSCYARCKEKKPCLCLQNIHVQDVLKAIEKTMGKNVRR